MFADLLNSFSHEISIFIAGAISTRKAFFTSFLKIITFLFFLERLHNFIEALKTSKFRMFLFKTIGSAVFTILTLFLVLMSSSFINGCAITSKNTLGSLDIPDMKDINSTKIAVSKIDNMTHTLNTKLHNNDKPIDTIALVKKLKNFNISDGSSKGGGKPRKFIIKHAKNLNRSDRSNFIKSIEVKACKELMHTLVESNKQFSNGCKLYYKNIMHFSDVKLTKKDYMKISSNRCEKFGTSFMYRWKVKIHTLTGRWPNINIWDTRQIQLSPEGDIYREVFITSSIRLHSYILRLSSKYKKCKLTEISKYNGKKVFGLLPKRNINEK